MVSPAGSGAAVGDGSFSSATATADGHASTPSSSSSACRWHRQRASPEGALGPTHAAVVLRDLVAFGTLWAFWAAESHQVRERTVSRWPEAQLP